MEFIAGVGVGTFIGALAAGAFLWWLLSQPVGPKF